jgi:HlyD family secretion protein
MSTNKETALSRRKWLVIGFGVIIVIVVALLVLVVIPGRQGDPEQLEAGTGEIVDAFIGDLSSSATASGQIQAQREAQLALDASGEVAEVLVALGDTVQAGDPLIRLDTAALERAAESARQDLIIQEANLATLLAPAKGDDLVAAEAAVTSAQAQLDDLLAGAGEEDINASDANVRAAQANVWAASEQLQLANSGAGEAEIASAQADLIAALGEQEATQDLYDNLLKCFNFELPTGEKKEICPGLGNPEEQTRFNLATTNANAAASQARLDALLAGPDADAVGIAQAGLAAANAQLAAAQANHDLLLKGASDAQIAGAELQLAQALAGLQALQDGPSESQVSMAEIAVEQMRLNVQRAENNLEKATLFAPFDGVITAVNVSEGETTSGILVEMVDRDSLEVVLDVDEVDIGNLSPGQPAVITLETWPDVQIDGQIASIAPLAKNDASALVTFEVFVSLGETELPVLVGMTADADLLTADQEGVLLAPNAAINANRDAGTYSVNRVTTDEQGNQITEEVIVTIGLRDNAFTQITSGLQEGDRLLVGNTLPVFDFQSSDGPPPGAEDSGPGGGGPVFGG